MTQRFHTIPTILVILTQCWNICAANTDQKRVDQNGNVASDSTSSFSMLSFCPSICNDLSTCDWKICSRCPREYSCTGSCTFEEDTRIGAKQASASIPSVPMGAICSSYCNVVTNPVQCRWQSCGGCSACTTCSISTFVDVTPYKLPPEDPYFHSWSHSGKPYPNEGSPLFVDLNEDGKMDFFNSMHGHGDTTWTYVERMEVGESVPWNFTGDGVITLKNSSNPNIDRFRKASYRVIITDAVNNMMDPHGENVVDLDNDGIRDIYIASGGSLGVEMDPVWARTRDNFLFWGENGTDVVTKANVTLFKGGRDVARQAGVDMYLGRGRFSYMLDVNRDGLLDIFVVQDRRVSNELAPGILLINQGNRTWRKDYSMQEFTRSMILADADGDGLAEEIIISRGFCYPQRDGPLTDPKNPSLGPYTQDVLDFCSTRPVGTTAIYKYNFTSKQMNEISPKYWNVSPFNHKQPPCCQNGDDSTAKNCHAKSIAVGDFDGDLLPDFIFLYVSKMQFYFSSDRPKGSLPLGKQYMGAEIYFPSNCYSAASVRVVDLNNDGTQELLVMCEVPGNVFFLYTKGATKDSWTLDNKCNVPGGMGDLVDDSLIDFTEKDRLDSCSFNKLSSWKALMNICLGVNSTNATDSSDDSREHTVQTAGTSLVDLNNDGFMDIVVTYDFGYTRYFHNVPTSSQFNKFIIFTIRGAGGSNGNVYGIGATVILYGTLSNGSTVSQVRYITSYQHTSDKYGTVDERLIFGLGNNVITPNRAVVRWPDGTNQTTMLTTWTPAKRFIPIKIVQIKS